jgi:hypothetical protein
VENASARSERTARVAPEQPLSAEIAERHAACAACGDNEIEAKRDAPLAESDVRVCEETRLDIKSVHPAMIEVGTQAIGTPYANVIHQTVNAPSRSVFRNPSVRHISGIKITTKSWVCPNPARATQRGRSRHA